MEVTLNHDQVIKAVQVGQMFTDSSKHRKDAWGLVNDDEVVDARRQTIGMLGETALCQIFGVTFDPKLNTFKAPDLVVNGWGLQVKSTTVPYPSLTIRPDAKDWEPYILCYVEMGQGDPREWLTQELLQTATVTVLGWYFPYVARLVADVDTTWWRDPNGRNSPAIFVPYQQLNDFESLKKLTEIHVSGYDLS